MTYLLHPARHLLNMWAAFLFATLLGIAPPAHAAGTGKPITLLALGDSLTAGYGLAKGEGYPPKLEAALRDKGMDVRVVNAGVSGDTSAGGRARLDWALADNPDAAIVALGANDALRGLEPKQMYDNLKAILTKLKDKNIAVLLAGMKAPPNMGPEYGAEFEEVYARLAQEFDVVFYPFLLDGVAADRTLNQDDGVHPTAEGYDVLVRHLLPSVEKLLSRAGT